MSPGRGSDLALVRRLFRLARRYWLRIPIIFAVSLLATPLALLVPVPLAIAIDSVLGGKPLPAPVAWILPAGVTDAAASSSQNMLLLAAALAVVVAVLTELQRMAETLLSTWTGEQMLLDIRSRLFDHAQRLSLAYHDRVGSADAIYRIQNDVPSIQSLAIGTVSAVLASGVTFLAMAVVMIRLDWQLGLIALTVTPMLLLTNRWYKARARARYRHVKLLESSALGIVQEVLASLRLVRAFGQEEREHRRFVDRSTEGLRARLGVVALEGGLGIVISAITALGTAGVLYVGVRHVQQGSLTLGQLTIVMSYLAQLYNPLKTLSRKIAGLQGSLTSAERVFEVLDEAADVPDAPDAVSLTRSSGVVAFDHVDFAYGRDVPVLRGVTFEVPAGAKVGVVGPTGAGKSTLASLLTRFYDPTSGAVYLDGRDIRDYKLRDLRNQFAVVLQDTRLFSASVAENIAYSRPDASLAEIKEAASAADAHDFIAALPDGYDTLLGENGMTLSGGQRQRLSLARAFLKDAPLLILDEPTSSVDVHTEARIMDALDRLMEGRTTFMIAHRVSTLDRCDIRLEVRDREVHQTVCLGAGAR